jgi:peroxiredoxin
MANRLCFSFIPGRIRQAARSRLAGFATHSQKLQAAGAVVLGISRDTPKDQAKFRAKFDLPYTLLCRRGREGVQPVWRAEGKEYVWQESDGALSGLRS